MNPQKKYKLFFLIPWLGLLVALWCSPALAQTAIKRVDEKRPVALEKEKTGRVSYLKTVKTQAGPSVIIGELNKGKECRKSGNIVWSKNFSNQVVRNYFRIFREELERANYPVPVSSEKVFEQSGSGEKQSGLQVGIFIKEVKATFCANPGNIKGGVYMKIFWQVFFPELQKVVFEATTEGSYQPMESEKTFQAFFDKAFAVASRNFLSEKGFADVVTKPSLGDPAKRQMLRIKGASPPEQKSKMDITAVRSSVVTVVGEKGSGSGFFISTDGYVLTNQHVVGNAGFLKVKTASGRELVGEVIRVNKNRDVALIKTEPVNSNPLAIRKTDLNIGDDVYALGSPLGHTFNTSLTRGILSGYRTIKKMEFIQSDVTILPGSSGGPLLDPAGSVIGIAVSGVVVKGFSGMNFFIPARDALDKLDVILD